MIKVKGHEGYYRDTGSKAIINKNKKAYAAHRARRNAAKENAEKMVSLETQVAELQAQVAELVDIIKNNSSTSKGTTKKSST